MHYNCFPLSNYRTLLNDQLINLITYKHIVILRSLENKKIISKGKGKYFYSLIFVNAAYTMGKFMSRPFVSASTCAVYYAQVIISQKYIVPLFNRLAQLDAAARYNFLRADKRLQTSRSRQPCATRP